MSITFACRCGKSFRVNDDLAGKRTKCPACSAVLVVPEPAGGEFEVIEEGDPPPAPGKKKAVKAKASVVEDDEPAGPKKKKKKKKKATGIDREEWDAEDEKRRFRAYAVKRMTYMIVGAVAAVLSVGALGLFWYMQIFGVLTVLPCMVGLLGGLYCAWQGFSGDFDNG